MFGDPAGLRSRLQWVSRALTDAVVVAVVLLVGYGTAAAHAALISITPADGEIVDVAPADVVLTFSEPVSLTGGSVRVLDDAADDVATVTTQAGDSVTVELADGLADGTYTVVWEVVSVDSHRVSGASVFHVGAPSSQGLTADQLDLGGDDAGWGVRLGAAILTAIAYLGALVAAGTLCFSLYAEASDRLLDVASKAAVLGAVALVAATPFRIARLGGGLDALRDNDVLTAALRGPIGVSTAVTALALLVAAVLVDRGAPRWVPTTLTIVALGGFAIEGHTRTPVRRWWLVGSDVIHLAAAAVWLGGIVALVLAFRAMTDARPLAAMVRRFSDVALIAVGIVAVTGVTMAWIILPSAGELTSTGYGLALLVKVALVVVLITLGAFNRYRLVPAVDVRRAAPDDEPQQPPQARARRRLGNILRVELALLLSVVGVTAVMVTRSPLAATTAAAGAAAATNSETNEMVMASVTLSDDGGTAGVMVMPAGLGSNTIDIVLDDVEGRVIKPYEAPVVELSLPAADIGPLRPEVFPLGVGHYQANADLSFAGNWELTIRVRTSEFKSVVGTTTLTIG
jgi:copper transport protein